MFAAVYKKQEQIFICSCFLLYKSTENIRVPHFVWTKTAIASFPLFAAMVSFKRTDLRSKVILNWPP